MSNSAILSPATVYDVEKQDPSALLQSGLQSPSARDSHADDVTVVDHAEQQEPDLVEAPGEPPFDKEKANSEFLVKWDGPNDPENPKNWSELKRWYITGVAGLLVLNATFASSAPSGVIDQLTERFGLVEETQVLTIGLFVAGYCVGPLVWGPLSEQYGRKNPMLVAFFVYTCFQVAAALAPNTAALLIFRFLGGTFAASPLTTSGGIIADMWDPITRGKALAFFTLAPFAGPAVGPIVGGYIDVGGASWHWLFWTLAMFAGSCFFLILFTVPETYAPTIHTRKAIRKRKETGDDRWFSELEVQDIDLRARLESVLGRPFKVLFLEPMLMAITLYMSFVYGCIYLLFEAYPIVYTEGHNLNSGESGLTFLPLFLGGAIGVLVYLVYFNPRYAKLIPQYAPRPVPPEARLLPAFYGGPLLLISFLWFGWTSYPSLSIWAALPSGLPMGIGVILIFLALFNYIIDAYLMVAASALAASTVVRSIFGAGFPTFATQMYEKLSPRWASTLLAGITLILIPIPFILYRYGAHIRRTSKYAPTFD
ncbi:hypothetical protein FRB96_005893 [Tulasnella sp. 330]|nr:hypothetical protein FRB96_005893 [Tulasnella sp. 330]KAG8869253.1 hypothetical protein FRB98_002744 [Tulasnella sp. 332]KAG8870567.1 hypothetical protein FRB97_009649 [Tulasnella sp. 331]